ncbi:MAG: antibiotic ABC transporter ATP-binding protein [Flavobacteriales bacterium]|nr:antibiotic ABC transporter ATP-binding protein [Flavobacteriales bacterium]|tara:strand:- start:998 stop:2809 length:1812 start_codon:yes stop_codon:yes gene_type:complete
MKHTLEILKFSFPYSSLIALNTLFNFLSVIFSLFSISLIIPILGLLFGTIEAKEAHIAELNAHNLKDYFYNYINVMRQEKGVINVLGFICVLVGCGTILKNTTRYLALYFLTPLRNNVIRDIRMRLYTNTLKLPLKFIKKFKKGDLVARMTTDLTEIEWSIMGALELFIKDPIHIIVFVISLIYISPQLTLISLVFLPVTAFIITKLGKSLRRKSLLSQNKIGALMSSIEESISNVQIIKGFNAYQTISNTFREKNEALKHINNNVLWRKDLASPMSEMLSTLVLVFIIWIGGRIVLETNLAADSFIGFLVIFSQILPPAKSLTTAFYSMQKGSASAERVLKILDYKIDLPKNMAFVKNLNQGIVFHNVSFKYNSNMTVKNINLTINKGQKIAVVGESGSGKSTLLGLLLKFHKPSSGDITIDGNNIKSTNIKSLFSVVTQDVMLFNDTILNNLKIAKPNVEMPEIEDVAKKASIHRVINNLNKQYNTILGPQGNSFSGGERQRIAIARALLSEAPILIFDEPTSSLDSESDKNIQKTFNNLNSDKTLIMITHKLNGIKHYDKIIVMKKGEIIEEGKHMDLLKKNGEYKKLYELELLKKNEKS